MNRLVPYAALILAVAAFALAVHAGSSQDVQPSGGPAVDMRDLATVRVLEERTAALEKELARLGERTAALERRTGGVPSNAPVATPSPAEPSSAPAEQPSARTANEVLSSPVAREELKDAVRSVQDEMREEGRRAFVQQMVENMGRGGPERLQKWKQFAADMKLNYSQEQSLMQAMEAEEALRKGMSEAVASGAKNPREAQRELRQKREETDETVRKTLDPSQAAKYETMRREERRIPRGQGGDRGQQMR